MSESKLSEHAEKLATAARRYRAENPSATPSFCMSMAAGDFTMAYHDDATAIQIVHFAMKELAAAWIFQKQNEPTT